MALLKINGFQLKSQYSKSPPQNAGKIYNKYRIFVAQEHMHSICNYCSNLWAGIRVRRHFTRKVIESKLWSTNATPPMTRFICEFPQLKCRRMADESITQTPQIGAVTDFFS